MTTFRHLKSVVRLNELAEDPLDLSEEGAVTPKRIETMVADAVNFKLFYGMERVSETTLGALCELAEETQAIKKMGDMQAGEIVNFIEGHESENRPALHTAMRDFFENRNTSEKAKEAAELAYKECEKLRSFLDEVEKKGQFTTMVQIGIGGSELGPKAVYMALEAFHKPGERFISYRMSIPMMARISSAKLIWKRRSLSWCRNRAVL